MSALIHTQLLTQVGDLQNLKKIIKLNGVLFLERKKDDELFEHLAKTVVGQQLSIAAANTIWKRVLDLYSETDNTLLNYCLDINSDKLKKCGLSKNKTKALVEISIACRESQFPKEVCRAAEIDTIIKRVSSLYGLGKWSAEMTGIFFFALENVWSEDDAALRRGLMLISERDSVEPITIIDKVSPYKSYLALHIWKGLDTGIL